MRIAWISYLDAQVFGGGGELHQRSLIAAGRERGHVITESPFLRARPQRLLRRSGLYRRLDVDWDADAFVLSDIENCPELRCRIPRSVATRALGTGRAIVYANAWVDVCRFNMPCGGDPERCRPDCDRSWADALYDQARVAVFMSPMHRDMIAGVLSVPLPEQTILCRPPIEVDMFKPLGLHRDIDVLYVGTINETKGYKNLIDRFGPGSVTFAGRKMIDGPLAGTFLGEVPHERLPETYNRAKVFAHLPEWHEPFGRTIVEAALCGCQVVTNSRVGAMSYPDADWSDPAN